MARPRSFSRNNQDAPARGRGSDNNANKGRGSDNNATSKGRSAVQKVDPLQDLINDDAVPRPHLSYLQA
jgi:hypothetical protein